VILPAKKAQVALFYFYESRAIIDHNLIKLKLGEIFEMEYFEYG